MISRAYLQIVGRKLPKVERKTEMAGVKSDKASVPQEVGRKLLKGERIFKIVGRKIPIVERKTLMSGVTLPFINKTKSGTPLEQSRFSSLQQKLPPVSSSRPHWRKYSISRFLTRNGEHENETGCHECAVQQERCAPIAGTVTEHARNDRREDCTDFRN